MLTKNDLQSGDLENNRKYHLLADPTLRLAIPHLVMQIDSNQRKIRTSDTARLQALSKVTVTASIRDNNGVVQNINSDSALVNVFDAEPTDSVYDSGVSAVLVGSIVLHSSCRER